MYKLKIDIDQLEKNAIVDVNENNIIVNSELVLEKGADGAYYLSDCQTDLFFDEYVYSDALIIVLPINGIDYAVTMPDYSLAIATDGDVIIEASIDTHCEGVTLHVDIETDTDNSGVYDAPRELVHHAIDDSVPMYTRLLDVITHCAGIV